ncbi:zinc-dependent metalloprotease [Natronocalculus amylovorans]|uniref:Zinc-dependent metalloprotease n=1 Tax=Natronocalculus amylovorans TaxID=2917812 RepID=A0AAE3FZ56_9EURY|nr:zinc-dependent metalloprotease [Natronocalculus amylovorans]MCL9817890.1 zinc-dependent metalloprotease [Natronocalculus amylovorans]
MDLYRSVRAVADASGNGVVDWDAVGASAKAATEPGDLTLTPDEEAGYADDVRDARDRLRLVGDVKFELPDAIEVQNRHHWINANIATFRRVMEPIEAETQSLFPDVARTVNTGTMAFTLSYLSRNVLGQYDPLLLADSDDHGLYFVRPNILRVADELRVPYPRFRRWIAFHEVAHAAEFGAAPWLPDYLEDRMHEAVSGISSGSIDRASFKELNVAMTAVEGYAELLMDRAFDEDYTDLRRKLDARRQGGGPVARIMRRLLGLGMKRRQYERGARFFAAVADERGVAAASAVWERPENLPTDAELDRPQLWINRVHP